MTRSLPNSMSFCHSLPYRLLNQDRHAPPRAASPVGRLAIGRDERLADGRGGLPSRRRAFAGRADPGYANPGLTADRAVAGRDCTLCTIFSGNQSVISEKSLVGFCDSRAKSCIACDLCQGTEHVTRKQHGGHKDAARKRSSTCHNYGDTEERGSLMMDAQVPVKPEGVADDVWAQMLSASPVEARHLIRSGEFTAPTSGLCPGYAQANLIVLPKEQAYDFLLFAQRNPKPCPLLEVTEVGAREAAICATDCDIATDFPRYRI